MTSTLNNNQLQQLQQNGQSNVSLVSNASSVEGVKEKPKSTMQLNKDSTSFIQLIGMPPPDLMDTSHTLGPGLASSAEANALNQLAFPHLMPDECAGGMKIDLIDASNEDPFTLETFDLLIKSHLDAGKDFIIARVLTMDEKDPENRRLFYSYYAAHQINRTLFRTQPEEGLLHRMKAKNPMNNLTIVGDVHYYVIKAAEPFGQQQQQSGARNLVPELKKISAFGINKSTSMISREVTVQEMLLMQMDDDEHDSVPNQQQKRYEQEEDEDSETNSVTSCSSAPEILAAAHPRRGKRVARRSSMESSMAVNDETMMAGIRSSVDEWKLTADKRRKHDNNIQPSETIAIMESDEAPNKHLLRPVLEEFNNGNSNQSHTVTYTAQYYATDDDYLMRRYIREFFKQNALNLEDIFLFTLFGASQHNGETFSSPFVSDPTNPAAVAAPLNEAIQQYIRLLAQQSSQANGNSSDSNLLTGGMVTSGSEDQNEDDAGAQSGLSSIFSRIRGWLGGGRPRYAPASVNNNNNNNNNNNSAADNLSDLQDQQDGRPQNGDRSEVVLELGNNNNNNRGVLNGSNRSRFAIISPFLLCKGAIFTLGPLAVVAGYLFIEDGFLKIIVLITFIAFLLSLIRILTHYEEARMESRQHERRVSVGMNSTASGDGSLQLNQ